MPKSRAVSSHVAPIARGTATSRVEDGEVEMGPALAAPAPTPPDEQACVSKVSMQRATTRPVTIHADLFLVTTLNCSGRPRAARRKQRQSSVDERARAHAMSGTVSGSTRSVQARLPAVVWDSARYGPLTETRPGGQ